MTERTTRRQLEAQIKILSGYMPDVKVSYGHYKGRYILELDEREIGHHLGLGDFYSSIYGMNCAFGYLQTKQYFDRKYSMLEEDSEE